MRNMHICQIKGRLAKDPELKETKTGKKVLSFTLAYHSFQGEGAENENVHFIGVDAWEKLAEIFSPCLEKEWRPGERQDHSEQMEECPGPYEILSQGFGRLDLDHRYQFWPYCLSVNG